MAASAPSPVKDDGKPWPEAQFEIFKIAPGRQEAFIRKLAQWDEVSAAGGNHRRKCLFFFFAPEAGDTRFVSVNMKTPAMVNSSSTGIQRGEMCGSWVGVAATGLNMRRLLSGMSAT